MEFMLNIFNEADGKQSLSAEAHLSFVTECEIYIGELTSAGNLIAAQPISDGGIQLTKHNNHWIEAPVPANARNQVGYYHIKTDSIEEAIAIAKRNPEFKYIPGSSVEIKPVKLIEKATQFEYPR